MKAITKTFCSLTIIFCFPVCLFSADFNYIDSISMRVPEREIGSIDNLVQYCENHTTNDADRTRFYFVWIATHVHYDDNANRDKQNIEAIFSSRKAVCSGYTRLFSYLCEQSGLLTRYVGGYGKDTEKGSTIENHAWNIVCINGIWQHFDVTWASTELLDDSMKVFTPEFNRWFMASSKAFQLSHLPYDPVFQLSQTPISRTSFFDKNTLTDTEGGGYSGNGFDFVKILDDETVLDSIERTWRSFRRAYYFMPSDSTVAIKLAKIQDAKVQRVFEPVHYFYQHDFQKLDSLSFEELSNWQSKLKKLDKPTAEALHLHKELTVLPLSGDNKEVLEKNDEFYCSLSMFLKRALNKLNVTIMMRQ